MVLKIEVDGVDGPSNPVIQDIDAIKVDLEGRIRFWQNDMFPAAEKVTTLRRDGVVEHALERRSQSVEAADCSPP